MLGSAIIGSILLAPAAPVPVPPPALVSPADRTQANQFGSMIFNTAQTVRGTYYLEVGMKEMLAGAIRGLHDEAGLKIPEDVLQAIDRAGDNNEMLNLLIETRIRLGNLPALAGPRSLFAAVNGFKYATDPYCSLANQRINSIVSSDNDFYIGLELEGANGQRWSAYLMEFQIAAGALPATGTFGPLPKLDAVPSPAGFPWRVRRVIPGSPAQRAGVRPGDTLTHFNGEEITAANANRLFAKFAQTGTVFDPNTGQPLPLKRTLKFKRGNAPPFEAVLETQHYVPESIFGVMRKGEGKWDCLLDRDFKIGYVRVGPVEEKSDVKLAEMLDELIRQGCRGLILDLRWCPGGYVTPGTLIAGQFLKANDIVAQVKSKPIPGSAPLPEIMRATAPSAGKFSDVPILVLVGFETLGGGELIAAALQDNRRCEVMGQRTAGRAALQNTIEAGFGHLQYKVTTGATLRPTGKPRGKLPGSKPTDDWGIKPDPGLEVPITADLSAKLKRWAEEHALRPAESLESLEFDDPAKDPYRTAALAHLRKKLGPPK